MNEQSFEQRVQLWLDLGPTVIPEETVQSVLTTVDAIAQDRVPLRVLGRAVPVSRLQLFATAAALVVAVTAAGAILVRGEAPGPGDLLFGVPGVTKVIERTGGPSAADEQVSVGEVRENGTYVIAASCVGQGGIVINVHDGSRLQGPNGEDLPNPEPINHLAIACDGEPDHLDVTTKFAPAAYAVSLAVDAGVTWRVEVGEYRDFSTEPNFPAIEPTEGWHLVMDGGMMLTVDRPGPGIGIQVPTGATKVAVLVQCSGAEITLTAEGADDTKVPCDDPSRTARVEYPATGLFQGVNAGADGPSWVHLVAQADGAMSAARPSAPPLPPELAGIPYADADGEYVAFGTLGSEVQTAIQLSGARAGLPAGDRVGVTTPDGDSGTKLELWSMSEAAAIGTLARTTGSDTIYGSWVDATHEQVFYGVSKASGFAGEWHRVAFDGSGDEVIGASPIGLVMTGELLAADDSVFLVHWCTAIGPCTRLVHDTATGVTREVRPSGDRRCQLLGAAAGLVAVQTAPTCDESGPTVVEDLDGGSPRVIVEGPTTGTVVLGPDGPALVYGEGTETRTTYSVVPLDGGVPREIAVFDHDSFQSPQVSRVRLPAGDWVLLAGPLADTPSNQAIGRSTPLLLNISTGEQIELVNLPSSRE